MRPIPRSTTLYGQAAGYRDDTPPKQEWRLPEKLLQLQPEVPRAVSYTHLVPYVHTFDFTPARRDLRGVGAFETFFQQLSRTRKKQAQRTPHRKKHYICDPERH